MKKREVKPYREDSSKKEQVARMFDNISGRYDFLNHLLSLNIDKAWRNRVVRMVRNEKPQRVLDVATGTADLAIALRKSGASEIVGIDISQGMLDVGQQKIEGRKLTRLIRLQQADSEDLPFPDNHFEAVTVAFGVRNFEDLQQGLKEMRRVLRPGGQVLILEFAQPTHFPFRQIYRFYFKHILPRLGKLISRDSSAYTYLPASVDAFPYGRDFTAILEQCGYAEASHRAVTFGVANIYRAVK